MTDDISKGNKGEMMNEHTKWVLRSCFFEDLCTWDLIDPGPALHLQDRRNQLLEMVRHELGDDPEFRALRHVVACARDVAATPDGKTVTRLLAALVDIVKAPYDDC